MARPASSSGTAETSLRSIRRTTGLSSLTPKEVRHVCSFFFLAEVFGPENGWALVGYPHRGCSLPRTGVEMCVPKFQLAGSHIFCCSLKWVIHTLHSEMYGGTIMHRFPHPIAPPLWCKPACFWWLWLGLFCLLAQHGFVRQPQRREGT